LIAGQDLGLYNTGGCWNPLDGAYITLTAAKVPLGTKILVSANVIISAASGYRVGISNTPSSAQWECNVAQIANPLVAENVSSMFLFSTDPTKIWVEFSTEYDATHTAGALSVLSVMIVRWETLPPCVPATAGRNKCCYGKSFFRIGGN
jgi:hypothetical protein